MNSVLVFCVGMVGAANPAVLETQTHQPVQVVAANYGILPGGCYQPAAYRAPVAQNAPYGYSIGTANCANGQCAPVSAANCANGWCGTTTPASYSARPYSPVSYSQSQVNCPGGQCPTAYGTRPATCYGPNCPPQVPGNYAVPTYQTRYNTVPATRFPAPSYTQPRINSYPTSYPGNWSSQSRTLPASYNQNSNSPFFN
jgi:hypothetical protein